MILSTSLMLNLFDYDMWRIIILDFSSIQLCFCWASVKTDWFLPNTLWGKRKVVLSDGRRNQWRIKTWPFHMQLIERWLNVDKYECTWMHTHTAHTHSPEKEFLFWIWQKPRRVTKGDFVSLTSSVWCITDASVSLNKTTGLIRIHTYF